MNPFKRAARIIDANTIIPSFREENREMPTVAIIKIGEGKDV